MILNDDLSGKAAGSHSHDDRYYTESEVDSKISAIDVSAQLTPLANRVTALETKINGMFTQSGNTLTINI